MLRRRRRQRGADCSEEGAISTIHGEIDRQQAPEMFYCSLQLVHRALWPWHEFAEYRTYPIKEEVILRMQGDQQGCHGHEHAEEQQNAQKSQVNLQVEPAHYLSRSSS
jgi:hypothetical protein